MWKCNKCGWQGDEPLICPGVSGGQVVDIIDIMCPNPCDGTPEFLGTQKECVEWWERWEANNDE